MISRSEITASARVFSPMAPVEARPDECIRVRTFRVPLKRANYFSPRDARSDRVAKRGKTRPLIINSPPPSPFTRADVSPRTGIQPALFLSHVISFFTLHFPCRLVAVAVASGFRSAPTVYRTFNRFLPRTKYISRPYNTFCYWLVFPRTHAKMERRSFILLRKTRERERKSSCLKENQEDFPKERDAERES